MEDGQRLLMAYGLFIDGLDSAVDSLVSGYEEAITSEPAGRSSPSSATGSA